MNPKIIHAFALLTAIASGILMTADRITPLLAISPQLAHLWPFVMAASVAIVNIGKLISPSAPPVTPMSAKTTPAPLPSSILKS